VERRRFIQIAGLAALGTVAATPCASAADKQKGWSRCKKCEGLFIEEWVSGDNGQQSVCPAGEKHSLEDTSFYVLTVNDNGGSGQKKWRWRHKCQGLWFSEGDENGKCPAGDTHSDKDSGDYALEQDGKGQENWRRCRKCQGLWFAGSGNAGKCPAGDGHVKTDSGNYTLERESAYAQPPVSGKQSPGVELLDAVMLNYLKKIGCSAASLTVARSHHAGPQGMRPTADQGPLYSRGYGWSDSHQKVPMQPDTPMSLASCDKPFTAAAIRQLALDGKLELNASVFKLLKIEPKAEVVDKRVWDVTINHLLEHKAGWQGEPYLRAWQAANGKKDPISAETKLPYVMVQKLAWAPGEKAEYDSFGYATLSLIVEKGWRVTRGQIGYIGEAWKAADGGAQPPFVRLARRWTDPAIVQHDQGAALSSQLLDGRSSRRKGRRQAARRERGRQDTGVCFRHNR
jgi:hypothetical protein